MLFASFRQCVYEPNDAYSEWFQRKNVRLITRLCEQTKWDWQLYGFRFFFCVLLLRLLFLPLLFLAVIFGCFVSKYIPPYGKAKCRGEKHDKDFVGVGIWLWNCWKWSLNMHSPPALMQFEMCSIPLYSHASMLKSRFRHIALQLHNCARCRFGNFGFSVCLHLLNTSGNDAICAENNHPKNRCAF